MNLASLWVLTCRAADGGVSLRPVVAVVVVGAGGVEFGAEAGLAGGHGRLSVEAGIAPDGAGLLASSLREEVVLVAVQAAVVELDALPAD